MEDLKTPKMPDGLALEIEALIFASAESITVTEIMQVVEAAFGYSANEKIINSVLEQIKEKYNSPGYAIGLAHINAGYQFLTKKAHHTVINQLQVQRSKKKLTQAAMETLAIIAYRQPVTKLEIEQIRGVNCDYTIQRLLEKDLISIAGKGEGVGRPLLYSTSPLFMDYFGISSTTELPQLKDFISQENEIGDIGT